MTNTNTQLLDMIKEIADAKEVTIEIVIASLEDAMKKAYEKEFPEETAEVKIDAETGKISLFKVYTVVEDATEDDNLNEYCQMKLADALKLNKDAKVGETVKEAKDFYSLDRKVVLHILQVFKHDISIESNKSVYKEWAPRIGSIVYEEVEKIDSRSKLILVNLGKTYGVVTKVETNPDEKLEPGFKYNFVVKTVMQNSKGWPVILSRADGLLVKHLLTTNIPEISNGVVEIVKVGRAAGFKSKVAVKSNQPGIDPIGACIGARADRIKPILQEMGNEKIEFVRWDEDFGKYLVNVCSPAPIYGYKVIDAVYETDEQGNQKEVSRKKVIIVVNEYKLALILGSRGKNVRIISNLLDADVEVVTIEEANEAKVDYIKAERIQIPVDATAKKKPVNKFDTTYDKFHSSAYDLLNDIDQNNADEAKNLEAPVEQPAPVIEEVEPEEEVTQISQEDLDAYASDLAELNELTKDVKKKE